MIEKYKQGRNRRTQIFSLLSEDLVFGLKDCLLSEAMLLYLKNFILYSILTLSLILNYRFISIELK